MRGVDVFSNPYPDSFEPKAQISEVNGRTVIRFEDLYDACYWDYLPNQEKHNLSSSGTQYAHDDNYSDNDTNSISYYMKNRFTLTEKKKNILDKVQRNLKIDKDFQNLIHKAKTEKRAVQKNKFVGNLSIVDFAKQNEKMFERQLPGAKKSTLNLAFQVGTFAGGDYEESFTKIIKTVLMCQALGVSLNIDTFDSDTRACAGNRGYTIINVAKSYKKLNFAELLIFSHEAFFRYTLFNSYLQLKRNSRIRTFLDEYEIVKDLGDRYDIIGGNMINKELDSDDMVSRVIKIANLV